MDINYLYTLISTIQQDMIDINKRVTKLEHALPKYATHGQLKTSEANTKNIINNNSKLINELQIKLQTVSTPIESQYYLNSTEIEDFRTNYKQLITMMADAENIYQALISYTVQNTTP